MKKCVYIYFHLFLSVTRSFTPILSEIQERPEIRCARRPQRRPAPINTRRATVAEMHRPKVTSQRDRAFSETLERAPDVLTYNEDDDVSTHFLLLFFPSFFLKLKYVNSNYVYLA